MKGSWVEVKVRRLDDSTLDTMVSQYLSNVKNKAFSDLGDLEECNSFYSS